MSKGFTIVCTALDGEPEFIYLEHAISMAVQIALKFKAETKVLAHYEERSEIIALIKGNLVKDYHPINPREEKFLRVKP